MRVGQWIINGTVLSLVACGGGSSTPSSTTPSGTVSIPVNATVSTPVVSSVVKTADGKITVSGTATASATITATWPDNSTSTGVANSTGSFVITSTSNSFALGQTVKVKATVNGVSSAETQTIAIIDLMPVITSMVKNADGTVTVTGTGVAGSTVTITWPDNTTTSVVPASGIFTVTSTATTYSLSAKIKAQASISGVTSNMTAEVAVTDVNSLTGRLPHPGYTISQCYGTGGDILISCTDPTALDLSGEGKQDGMYADVNARSYTKIGFNKEVLPDSATSWCAVKDNITGLIWENHTTRPSDYTNYDSTTSAQKYDYATNSFVNPTQAEIDASTNSVGRKNAMNAANLCGYTDGQWRLPTVDELQAIVDYSKPPPGPTINTSYFQNTGGGDGYWSSSPKVGYSGGAWLVSFYDGSVSYDFRNSYYYGRVRLVRVGQ